VTLLIENIIVYLSTAVFQNQGLASASHRANILTIPSFNQQSTASSPSSAPLSSTTSTTSGTASTTNTMQSAPRSTKCTEPTLLFARHNLQVCAAQVEPFALALGVVAADHVAVRATKAVAVFGLGWVVGVGVLVVCGRGFAFCAWSGLGVESFAAGWVGARWRVRNWRGEWRCCG
jgi:hypothetical protein